MSRTLYKPGAMATLYRADGSSFFDEPGQNAIVVGGTHGTGLRVAFAITKTSGSEPNKCELVLSNLAEETRAATKRKPLAIILQAGYGAELRRLYRGDVRWVDTQKDGPTWNTTFLLGDGDRAYRHAKVNNSYALGSKVIDAVRDAATAMNLALPPEVENSTDLAVLFDDGNTLVGPARDALSQLLAPYGFRWSIQDGELVVLKDNDVRLGYAWPVGESYGMIGEPEFSQPDKKGGPQKMTIKSALYPELSPGMAVLLTSRKISGSFKIERVSHQGDTEGTDWTTEIECKIRK